MTTHILYRQISIISQEIIVTVIFTILFSLNCICTYESARSTYNFTNQFLFYYFVFFFSFSKKYPADNSLSQYMRFFFVVLYFS